MIVKKKILALVLATMLLAIQVGVSAAQGGTPPTPTPQAINWDGSTPMEQGRLYRLLNCNPADPNSPCYARIVTGTTKSGNVSIASSGTDTLSCTVEISNWLGYVVARLWQNVNVTWTSSQYSTANWASYGTWAGSGYDWRNVFGSSFNSPQTINYYSGGSTFSAGGDLYYLGANYGNHRVDLSVTGDHQWGCSGH